MRRSLTVLILLFFLAAGGRAESLYQKYKEQFDRGALLTDAIIRHPKEPHVLYEARVTQVVRLEDGQVEVVFKPTAGRTRKMGLFPVEEVESPGDVVSRLPTELRWVWREPGPVPLARGMEVHVAADKTNRVRKWLDCTASMRALRRIEDGTYEVVLQPCGAPVFLRLRPRYLGTCIYLVAWTDLHGLAIGNFQPETGGPSDGEIETAAMRRQGWPIANVPGQRILPGRDGWVAWKKVASTPDDWARHAPAHLPRHQWLPDRRASEEARSLSSDPPAAKRR